MNKFLDKASKAYYEGNPIISDEQFDHLAELFNYHSVGTKGGEAKHMHRMYSLQKHYDDQGESPLAHVAETNKVRSPKLDGAAISILYVDGKLAQATTRGDGIEGTDITDKMLATSLVPHTIRMGGAYQITGEIVAPKAVENSRNYAAGSLNLKSVEDFKTRAVQFFAYGIQPYVNETFSEDMELLRKLGFETVWTRNITEIYPTDGVVFRVDNNSDFVNMGFTSKHPRGAFALKERQEAVETELLNVEWQVGKSGKITPVAILKPVMIGDAEVSRATLNNQAFIQELGLYIGAQVKVIRSGEIIPTIIGLA